MSVFRIQGPKLEIRATKLPEQALSASNRIFELPRHMPAQLDERMLLKLITIEPGTELTAMWCPQGSKYSGAIPANPRNTQELIFDALAATPGEYHIYATVPKTYNCHWVLWMRHDLCVPYRYRGTYHLEAYTYRQRRLPL